MKKRDQSFESYVTSAASSSGVTATATATSSTTVATLHT